MPTKKQLIERNEKLEQGLNQIQDLIKESLSDEDIEKIKSAKVKKDE